MNHTQDAAARVEVTPPAIVDYRVIQCLGVGGFSVVWEAERISDGVLVALKIALDASVMAEMRLQREADALRAVGRLYAPACHGTGRTADGLMYMAMERLDGRTLASALEHMDGPPHMLWVWGVSEGLLDTLAASHAQGVIHRDLKPENVFLTSESPPKLRLFDFGLTLAVNRADESRLTRPGTILGSAEYMAPEQLRGERDLDIRVDIYAFGVMLYELFTLRPPFVGDRASIEHGHLSLRPPSPSQFVRVPDGVESVILSCLAKDPKKRPRNVDVARQALSLAWERAASRTAGTDERLADDADHVPGVQTNKLSLLVDKRQPVILAAIDTEAGPRDIAALVKRYGGFVARQRGAHYVCAFSGLMVDDPYESALTASREVVDQLDSRVTLHIAPLAIRRKRRRPMVIGRAVEQSMRWCPSGDWRGVLLTSALADTRPTGSTRPVSGHDGFVTPVDAPGTLHTQTALFGHEGTFDIARRSLRACIETETPGLFTLLGENGLGKSRLARELAALAHSVCETVRIVAVQAAKFDGKGTDDSMVELLEVFDALGVVSGKPESGRTVSRASGTSSDATSIAHRSRVQPVVVIVDDAQWCDSDILDRIEYATLDHPGVPLWVVVAVHPALEDMRAQWGKLAHRHERIMLEPLDETSAMKLAAELLLPAEYPPAAFLQRLASWAGGSPHLLTGLIAELKRRGVVRKRESGDGWFVATAELERLPAAPAQQWLAARIFDEMPPELAACARVCAVLGTTFTAEELSAIQRIMEHQGGAGTTMDALVGLTELVEYGLFEHLSDDRFAFKRQAQQDSVYQLLAESDRVQIHRYAATYWEPRVRDDSDGSDALVRFARHAGASDRMEEAAVAYARLGDAARHRHAYVEADTHFTAALRLPIQSAQVRAQALGGRGRVRYHIHRIDESFDDLRSAREILETLVDSVGVIDLLLEEATAADMGGEYGVSAERAERAWSELQNTDEPMLKVRGLMAMGRTHWRQGRVAKAIDMLGEAAEAARTNGDTETEIIALLLLGPALVLDGNRELAQEVFSQVITRCTEEQDYLHECAAYANRMFLWRNQPERAIDDLRRAIELARQVGNPNPEHTATHNLAVLLFWSGNEDEALALAHRSRVLQQRFWKQAPYDALLLARIYAARGESQSARRMIDWVKRECLLDGADSLVDIQYQLLMLVIGESPEHDVDARSDELVERWGALMERAIKELPTEESLEVLWWRVRQAIQYEQWEQARYTLSRIHSMLPDAPIWAKRVNLLTTTCVDVG